MFGKYIYLKSVSENWGYDGKEGKGRDREGEHATTLHTLAATGSYFA